MQDDSGRFTREYLWDELETGRRWKNISIKEEAVKIEISRSGGWSGKFNCRFETWVAIGRAQPEIWSERKPSKASRHRKFALFHRSFLHSSALSLFHWKYLLKISRKRRFFLENVVEKYIIWNDERSLVKKGGDRKGTNNFFYSQNLWQKKKWIKNKKRTQVCGYY